MIKEQSKFRQNIKKQPKSANGRWTKTQHERFMKGLQRYGRDWVSVQKIVKTRTLTQVRSHAQKVFLKLPQQDIQALIANQSEQDVQHYDEKSNTPKETVQKLESSESIDSSQIKATSKSQIDLVDIFMKAIENQQKQQISQQQHTSFPEMQITQQQQNILKPVDYNRKFQKAMELNRNKQNFNHENSCKNTKQSLQNSYQYKIIPIQIDLSSQVTYK